MTLPEATPAAALLEGARALARDGLSPGSSGNLSFRRGRGFVITPSGVAPEDLDEEVGKLAARLRHGPPVALAFTKRAIRRSLDLGRDAEFDYEVFAQVNCIQTEDHQEGVRAFFDEKRAPVFQGR